LLGLKKGSQAAASAISIFAASRNEADHDQSTEFSLRPRLAAFDANACLKTITDGKKQIKKFSLDIRYLFA
jgi:hypothetical protein